MNPVSAKRKKIREERSGTQLSMMVAKFFWGFCRYLRHMDTWLLAKGSWGSRKLGILIKTFGSYIFVCYTQPYYASKLYQVSRGTKGCIIGYQQ